MNGWCASLLRGGASFTKSDRNVPFGPFSSLQHSDFVRLIRFDGVD